MFTINPLDLYPLPVSSFCKVWATEAQERGGREYVVLRVILGIRSEKVIAMRRMECIAVGHLFTTS